MIYVSRLTIPAATAEAAPTSEELVVPLRFLRGAVVIFASGGSAVGIRILDKGGSFLPAAGSTEKWIRDNGAPIDLDFRYYLQDRSRVVVEAHNTSAGAIDAEIYIEAEASDPQQDLADEFHALVGEIRALAGEIRNFRAVYPALVER